VIVTLDGSTSILLGEMWCPKTMPSLMRMRHFSLLKDNFIYWHIFKTFSKLVKDS
jgi:hypothetical protein